MEIQNRKKADRRVMDEIWSIIAIALGVFLIVATLTNGAGQFGKAIYSVYTAVLPHSVRHTFVCEKSCFDLCKNCTAAHTPPLHVCGHELGKVC